MSYVIAIEVFDQDSCTSVVKYVTYKSDKTDYVLESKLVNVYNYATAVESIISGEDEWFNQNGELGPVQIEDDGVSRFLHNALMDRQKPYFNYYLYTAKAEWRVLTDYGFEIIQ